MDAETTELIINKKFGDSLSQLSQLTGLTNDQVEGILGLAKGLTLEELSMIFMKQEGSSLEQITQEVQVALEVLNQFLPQHFQAKEASERNPSHFGVRSVPKGMTKPAQGNPQFICCYKTGTGQLHRTNLLTGDQSSYQITGCQFKQSCRYSELPGGSLVITGGFGGYTSAFREVVKIDSFREFAFCSQPPMHTARGSHAALHHSQYLYVLGGMCNFKCLRECERYVCAESRWERLTALPVACKAMSAVVLDNSLYALGGNALRSDLDTVQKLSLDSLTWELM
jgi:hypothetical protein